MVSLESGMIDYTAVQYGKAIAAHSDLLGRAISLLEWLAKRVDQELPKDLKSLREDLEEERAKIQPIKKIFDKFSEQEKRGADINGYG